MKKWQQNIVLFDLDGTLTDSAEGIIRSVQHMQEKTGREVWKAEKLGFIVGQLPSGTASVTLSA